MSNDNEVLEPEIETGQELVKSDVFISLAASLDSDDEIERHIQRLQRYIKMSLMMTNHQDWLDIDGKPYLQESGASKLLRPLGLSVDKPTFEKEFKEGKAGEEVYYTCEVTVYRGSISHTAIGTACSSDDIFATRWKEVNGKKTRVTLPISEIDIGKVKKKAYTNALNRCIKGMLGLKNITWDDLKECGVMVNKVSGYSHKTEPTGDEPNCSKCNKPMSWKEGRYGKFLGCTGYPKCKETITEKKWEEMQSQKQAKSKDNQEGVAEDDPIRIELANDVLDWQVAAPELFKKARSMLKLGKKGQKDMTIEELRGLKEKITELHKAQKEANAE